MVEGRGGRSWSKCLGHDRQDEEQLYDNEYCNRLHFIYIFFDGDETGVCVQSENVVSLSQLPRYNIYIHVPKRWWNVVFCSSFVVGREDGFRRLLLQHCGPEF